MRVEVTSGSCSAVTSASLSRPSSISLSIEQSLHDLWRVSSPDSSSAKLTGVLPPGQPVQVCAQLLHERVELPDSREFQEHRVNAQVRVTVSGVLDRPLPPVAVEPLTLDHQQHPESGNTNTLEDTSPVTSYTTSGAGSTISVG